MAFSFYQSLRSIPDDLQEVSRSFQLSPWMKFWRLEVPFAMPPLIWNMMMSMSGGWFFVVVSEAITVGNTTVTLPGVGSYIALAIEQRNVGAIGYAIAAMFVVILIYDQLLFRPLIASADWFRLEQESGALTPSRSWALTMMRRSRLINIFGRLFAGVLNAGRSSAHAVTSIRSGRRSTVQFSGRLGDVLWYSSIALVGFCALVKTGTFVLSGVPAGVVGHVLVLGLITLLRVVVLIAIASLIWVPLGVAIGLCFWVVCFVLFFFLFLF